MSAHEDYPGQLAMLSGLVATLRAVATHGDLADVRKLLDEHERDEQDAIAAAEEKSSRPPADATPGPADRVAQLLAAIRAGRGEWTTRRVQRLYRELGIPAPRRMAARSDLRILHAMGHLVLNEDNGRRFYTPKTRKDGRS